MRRLWLVLKMWARRLVGLNDTPESIAAGTAIGVFIALLPVYGFQMILGASIAAVARVNKVAAALPAWLTNPVTIPPVLYLQYRLGRLLIPGRDPEGMWHRIHRVNEAVAQISIWDLRNTWKGVFTALKDVGWEVLLPTLVGSLISGVVLGIVTYPLMIRAVIWYRRKREELRRRRELRLAQYLAGHVPDVPDAPESRKISGARARRAARSTRVYPPGEASPPGP
jgi:uncharacterized protein (DUF2062 family)